MQSRPFMQINKSEHCCGQACPRAARTGRWKCIVISAVALGFSVEQSVAGTGSVVFDTTSPYHHIRVIDHGGMRTLCFDDAWESQIALNDPMKGHFEYTEYFHMPWLWNTQIVNVLMIGLGGGTTQRSFEHYYPDVNVQSVEIDPMVARVARDYFEFKDSNR